MYIGAPANPLCAACTDCVPSGQFTGCPSRGGSGYGFDAPKFGGFGAISGRGRGAVAVALVFGSPAVIKRSGAISGSFGRENPAGASSSDFPGVGIGVVSG